VSPDPNSTFRLIRGILDTPCLAAAEFFESVSLGEGTLWKTKLVVEHLEDGHVHGDGL
jgi:hypothetical protein